MYIIIAILVAVGVVVVIMLVCYYRRRVKASAGETSHASIPFYLYADDTELFVCFRSPSGGSRGRRLGQLPRAPMEGAPKRGEQK